MQEFLLSMLGFPTLVLSPGRREYMALGSSKFLPVGNAAMRSFFAEIRFGLCSTLLKGPSATAKPRFYKYSVNTLSQAVFDGAPLFCSVQRLWLPQATCTCKIVCHMSTSYQRHVNSLMLQHFVLLSNH